MPERVSLPEYLRRRNIPIRGVVARPMPTPLIARPRSRLPSRPMSGPFGEGGDGSSGPGVGIGTPGTAGTTSAINTPPSTSFGYSFPFGPVNFTASPFGRVGVSLNTGSELANTASRVALSLAHIPTGFNPLTMAFPALAPLTGPFGMAAGLFDLSVRTGLRLTDALRIPNARSIAKNAQALAQIESMVASPLTGPNFEARVQAIVDEATAAAGPQGNGGYFSFPHSVEGLTAAQTFANMANANQTGITAVFSDGRGGYLTGPLGHIPSANLNSNIAPNVPMFDTPQQFFNAIFGRPRGTEPEPEPEPEPAPAPAPAPAPDPNAEDAEGIEGFDDPDAPAPAPDPSDGGVCLLASYAMEAFGLGQDAPQRRFFSRLARLFLARYPETGLRQLALYQRVAKQILAKLNAASPTVQARVQKLIYAEVIAPTGAHLDASEVDATRQRLVTMTLALATRFQVPIPVKDLERLARRPKATVARRAA